MISFYSQKETLNDVGSIYMIRYPGFVYFFAEFSAKHDGKISIGIDEGVIGAISGLDDWSDGASPFLISSDSPEQFYYLDVHHGYSSTMSPQVSGGVAIVDEEDAHSVSFSYKLENQVGGQNNLTYPYDVKIYGVVCPVPRV